MENVRLIKILVLVGVFFGVVGFLGYYFFKADDEQIFTSIELTGVSNKGQEIFQALAELQNLSIDDGVFKLRAFETLQDFSININSEPIQRPNPYAPIGLEDITAGGVKPPVKQPPQE